MKDIQLLDKKYIWHPFTSLGEKYPPLAVKNAKNSRIFLENGDSLIDAVSSWWTNIHGHCNEELAETLNQQSLSLDHVIFAGFTHEPAVFLAQKLIQITDNNFDKVFFSDNGSTAVEVGLKIALQYWHNLGIKKTKIWSLEGAYHGDTFGAMSLAGKSDFFAPFNSFLFEIEQLPFPTHETIDDIEKQMEELAESGEMACLVLEPLVQGSAGMRMYDERLLHRIFLKAKELDALIVSDEVMTGFYRTGDFLASMQGVVKPDVIALSKGLSGGILPLGATLINKKITDAFDSPDKSKTFYHGHSFTANPITCSMALKSLEILSRPETQLKIENIVLQQKEAQLRFTNQTKLIESRCCGTILALEIKTEQNTSYFSEIRDKLYFKAINKGVLLRPLGNVIYALPPYCITSDELNFVHEKMEEIIYEI